MSASTGLLVAERTEVATAARRLARDGLVSGTSGNVSVRRDERVAVSATGAVLAELTEESVTVVDLDGRVLAGELAPTSELGLHLAVYARYGSGAVVHTHAPMATALGLVLDELPCVHYEMLGLGGSVRVAPYATFGSPELAAAVIEALDGKAAVLLANHGAVTHAHDLATALRATELLEWAATLYWRAASIGTPRTLTDADLAAVVEAATTKSYGSTRPAQEAC